MPKCNFNILHLHLAILLKDEEKYISSVLTDLLVNYFVEHPPVADFET